MLDVPRSMFSSSPMNSLPIGIFDSGVGGLTVLRAIRERLPQESLVYLGDTARVPYGNKSQATISRYALEDTRFLLSKGVKMIVIACNTASALAAPALRGHFPALPILGVIGPGARAAVAATRNRRIGIIATAATIGSGAYESRIREALAATEDDAPVHIVSKACPLFVPLVEEGETDTDIARLVAEKYLAGLRREEIDTLVLGCTHYPLLRKTIAAVMGESVRLVDSAEAAAAETAQLLASSGRLRPASGPPEEFFYVTDAAQRFQKTAAAFLGHEPEHLELAELATPG
jgi:glutamate racemase